MTQAASAPARLLLLVAALSAGLCGCISLSVDPRAVVYRGSGAPEITTLRCDDVARALHSAAGGETVTKVVERLPLRLAIWNIHKEGDDGWQADLSALAARSDLVLLQETVLKPELRRAVEDAGLSWVMASSFVYDSDDVGVLTATRAAPLASCTQRATEPLIRIPKSAVISWLPLYEPAGRDAEPRETLAVVNIHAVNFDLSTNSYRAQLEALADALGSHRGPIIFAGDFNTWNDARDRAMADVAARIGLKEIALTTDRRAVFFGRHLDHIWIRGLEVVDAAAIPLTSSDHNPMTATLRVP